MMYFGGKARVSKELSNFINNILSEEQGFVDAFCGSCNVVSKIDSNRVRVANDNHEELIAMWKAFQNGWEPSTGISEEDYKNTRKNGSPEMKAFVGFGCSYSGKYWGGYARGGSGRDYAKNALNSTLKKIKTMTNVGFNSGSYQHLEIPVGSLIYCDIPYKDTTGYSTGAFNHEEFYKWAKETPKVIVSEYAKNVPEGATVIWTHSSKKDIRNKEGIQEPTEEVVFTFDESIIQRVKEI